MISQQPTTVIPVCQICAKEFNLINQIPYVLPTCNHTLCLQCLKNLNINENIFTYELSVCCPFCKCNSSLGNNRNVDQFSKNYSLIEVIEKQQGVDQLKCPTHNIAKDIVCLDCQEAICYKCGILNHKDHNQDLVEQFSESLDEQFKNLSLKVENYQTHNQLYSREKMTSYFQNVIAKQFSRVEILINKAKQDSSQSVQSVVNVNNKFFKTNISEQIEKMQDSFNSFKQTNSIQKGLDLNQHMISLSQRVDQEDTTERILQNDECKKLFNKILMDQLEQCQNAINNLHITERAEDIFFQKCTRARSKAFDSLQIYFIDPTKQEPLIFTEKSYKITNVQIQVPCELISAENLVICIQQILRQYQSITTLELSFKKYLKVKEVLKSLAENRCLDHLKKFHLSIDDYSIGYTSHHTGIEDYLCLLPRNVEELSCEVQFIKPLPQELPNLNIWQVKLADNMFSINLNFSNNQSILVKSLKKLVQRFQYQPIKGIDVNLQGCLQLNGPPLKEFESFLRQFVENHRYNPVGTLCQPESEEFQNICAKDSFSNTSLNSLHKSDLQETPQEIQISKDQWY